MWITALPYTCIGCRVLPVEYRLGTDWAAESENIFCCEVPLNIYAFSPAPLNCYHRQFADASSIPVGSDIFIWAYLAIRGGLMQFLRTGIVSNTQEVSENDGLLYIETTAIDGTSGSPVFLRQGGQPVGIVIQKINVASAKLPSGIIAVVPGAKINGFLKAAGVPGF